MIAALIIVACFVLKALGQDSVLSWALLGVVGAYYGIDITPWTKLGLHKKPEPPPGPDTGSP